MSKLIQGFEPLNYDRQLINEAVESKSTLKVRGVLQRANAKNQNGRIYPKEILEREAKYYEKLIQERRALGELDHPDCHRPSTEILTKDGWKFIKNTNIGDVVYTLSTEGNIEEEQVRFVTNESYTGKMISFNGKNLNALVTPNHRFVVKNRKGEFETRTAQEILNKSNKTKVTHWEIPKTGNWNGVEQEIFTLPAVSLKYGAKVNRERQSSALHINAMPFFEFLGIYLAEGHLSGENASGYQITISQNEGEKANHIRTVLSAMTTELEWRENFIGKKVKFSVTDARLYSYLSELGNKYTKFIPTSIKEASTSLLENLVNGFLLGDGTTVIYKGYPKTSLFSVSKKLMEDFQEVLLKIGIASRIKAQITTRDYDFGGHRIKAENKVPLWRLYFDRSKSIHLDTRFMDITEVDYTGTVHCVTIPNGTFYARDGGKCFWSGNSAVINLKNVSHNITEMHFDGDDLVGEMEVLTTPSGNILKELLRNGIKLGVSSRGMGSVRELNEGGLEVQDDFELFCFDVVSNPSTHGAFLNEGVSRTQVSGPFSKIDSLVIDFLNELPKGTV